VYANRRAPLSIRVSFRVNHACMHSQLHTSFGRHSAACSTTSDIPSIARSVKWNKPVQLPLMSEVCSVPAAPQSRRINPGLYDFHLIQIFQLSESFTLEVVHQHRTGEGWRSSWSCWYSHSRQDHRDRGGRNQSRWLIALAGPPSSVSTTMRCHCFLSAESLFPRFCSTCEYVYHNGQYQWC